MVRLEYGWCGFCCEDMIFVIVISGNVVVFSYVLILMNRFDSFCKGVLSVRGMLLL